MRVDEAAEAMIAFLLQLDPATQRETLERIEQVMDVELDSDSARRRRIALALHEAKRTLGKSPSVREYRALRREHPENGWPDPRSLTRWLGVRSWNDALVRMRLDPVLDGDAIEGSIGPVYTIDNVVQALRDCAKEIGRTPTITDYLAWQRRPDVRDRPGRRPGSTWVFNRIFGGFGPARVAAGLVDDEAPTAHPSDLLIRSANYRLSERQILDDLRLVASRTTGTLTAIVYDRERRLVYQDTRAAGRPHALAGSGSIYRFFRQWPAALEAAGLGDRTWPSGQPPRRKRYSNEQLLSTLRRAEAATQGKFTHDAYLAWREQQCERYPQRRFEFPCISTFLRRFGAWSTALETAGLADPAWPSGKPPDRRRFPTEELLAVLSRAEDAIDGSLTHTTYEAWREQQCAQNPRSWRSFPTYQTIRCRFYSWQAAIEQMHQWRARR